MERYIAIDNVCAWPNLTLMPDGVIVVTIFNQPTHGGWEGDVECWASEDGGYLWHKRGTPAAHEPMTNRMNVAAGLAQDNALVVIASGWNHRPPRTQAPDTPFADSETLPLWVCRSQDAGRTWSRGGQVVKLDTMRRQPTPFGDIIRLNDGSLGAALYADDQQQRTSTYFYRSLDDGFNWGVHSLIGSGNHNETSLLKLQSGRLLAAVRTQDEGHLEIFASDDNGDSWAYQETVTQPRQHPGHLLQVADGRILLVSGLRNEGLYGVGGRVSDDDGQTWDAPRLLVQFEDGVDCGYPASVQVADGSLVTAYYVSRIPTHERYHMGVLRWQLEP